MTQQLLNNATFQQYAQNGIYSIGILLFFGFLAIFLFRNVFKNIFASLNGYRTFLDDYSFSTHENKDIIYENEVIRLTTGINLKNGVLLYISILTALINPFIFIGLYLFYKVVNVKQKLSLLKDFKIYKDIETDDLLIKTLNEKMPKINFLVNEIYFTSFILLGLGLYFGNLIIAFSAIILIVALLIAKAITIYNIVMYRMNYKQVSYFRGLRLFDSSDLSNKKELFAIGLFGFITNFTDLAGFSVFIWAVFAIEFILKMTISNMLKSEDNISTKHQILESRDYKNIENIASYPNPISQSRGYKFSTLLAMKFFQLEKEKKGKNLIHLDNYAFSPEMINRSDLRKNPLLLKTLKDIVKNKFETLDFTKQLLILGSMGSGKTEMINYMVEQVISSNFTNFKAIAFNDTKGDFTKNFYRADKDIIVNLYDNRSKVWDMFEEMKYNIEASTSFISNLFESLQGKEQDYFLAASKQKVSFWLQSSYFNTQNSIEAWEMFFKEIKNYSDEITAADNKTESSVLSNIKICLEILQIMYYQIVIEKKDTFTFNEFVYSKDTQLFFQNNKQYESKLTPYLTGLTATYINTIMGKEDTKEHLILNIFDEFLTMKIDDATRKTLLTATRSKGFANCLMAQYLINDEKLIQDLDSSRYALITFSIDDDFTLDKVSKKLAEAEILSTQFSPKKEKDKSNPFNGGGSVGDSMGAGASLLGKLIPTKENNLTYSLQKSEVIIKQQLQSLPQHHHITFIPKETTKVLTGIDSKRFFRLMAFGYDELMQDISNENDFLAKESGVLYLGYTPQAKLTYDNQSFEKWDMKEYYVFNHNKDLIESNKSNSSKTFSEKDSFIHYLNIKFADSEELAMQYLREHELYTIDLKSIYAAAEEDIEKVNKFLVNYTDSERYELAEKFFTIDEKNFEEKYQFCKENDLIGCILGIFKFSEDFIKSLDKEVKEDE